MGGTISTIFRLKLSEILVLSKGQGIRYQRSTLRCCIKLSSSRILGTGTLCGATGHTIYSTDFNLYKTENYGKIWN